MGTDENYTLSDFAYAIWRRKWLFLCVVSTMLLIGLAVILKVPVVFRSTGVILIEQQEIPTQWVNSTVASFADERIRTISQRVLSTSNMERIIDKFNLFPKLRDELTSDELVNRARNNFSFENVEAQVRDRFSGGRNSGTVSIHISYDYPSAVVARDVANELVSLYLAENLKARTNAATGTRRFLESEADRLEKELAVIERQISEFKERNIGILPEHLDINIQTYERVEQQIIDINRTLGSLEERRILIETSIGSARRLLEADSADTEGTIDPAQERLEDLKTQYVNLQTRYSAYHPDLIRLRREISLLQNQISPGISVESRNDQLRLLRTQLQELKNRYSDEHPEVIRVEREIALMSEIDSLRLDTNANLANDSVLSAGTRSQGTGANLNQVVPEDTSLIALQTDLQSALSEQRSLRARKADLMNKLEELEVKINRAPEVEREYRSLIRDHENIQEKYNDIRAKQNTARVAESLETEQKGERFTLIEAPRVADHPHSPEYRNLFLLAFGIAFLSGIGSVFGLELLDARVRNVNSLESLAGVPVLATIGSIRNRKDHRRRLVKIFILIFVTILLLTGVGYLIYINGISLGELHPNYLLNKILELRIDDNLRKSFWDSIRDWITNLEIPEF